MSAAMFMWLLFAIIAMGFLIMGTIGRAAEEIIKVIRETQGGE